MSTYCLDHDAEAAYATLRARLLDVNGWETLNVSMHTAFALYDASGAWVDRVPMPGDFIRIDLRGPGSPAGSGYDWVCITELTEQKEEPVWTAFTVRPSRVPGATTGPTAHFFTQEATNTFIVRKLGNCLYAEVHGRNERSNLPDDSLADRMRNRAVALAGKVGLGKVQWQDWTDGMISVIQPEPNG